MLDKEIEEIVESLYKEIFLKFKEQYIVVFLCGGISKGNKKSLRDKVRAALENEKRTQSNKPYAVFYPEDLLIEVLNKTKEADLLSYEQFLANNSHTIVIICESPGALVELGAFTNNEYTVDKVIAAIDKRHRKDKSFIMLGPIKHLRKRNRLNVTEYGQNDAEFAKNLSKSIREKNKNNVNAKNMIDLTTIVGMHYFIQLLLYLFKGIGSKDLREMIKYISEKEGIKYNDFNVLFNTSLKLLFQEKRIMKIPEQKNSVYHLTHTGAQTMRRMLSDCASALESDELRVRIMHNEFYKSPHS